MSDVTLSLISHTNVGKTTLARTLLRRDVGEVRDQTHVTVQSDAYVLLEADGDAIRLWDTPGFGDTVRLLSRLRRENDPVGWFLHQVWDRVVDRPLWCSQEAVRNIRDHADVVLYLVNATEDPEDAGYVALELEVLSWMKRPVLLLLNQVGPGGRDLVDRWRAYVQSWPVVRDVLSLDAFTRCWVEEGILLDRVVGLLEEPARDRMRRLTDRWNERNLAVFTSACRRMGEYLARAATDREVAGDKAAGDDERGAVGLLAEVLRFATVDKRRAMTALGKRLDKETTELMRDLISQHELSGESAVSIERELQDFQVNRRAAFNERSGALAGAVLTGALGGLAADALSGGLTLGGGMIAGGILGALGGSALARGFRWVGGDTEPSVRWTPEFLDQLVNQLLLRYLAVAHFGRGRGPWRDLERPEHWSEAVTRAVERRKSTFKQLWKRAEESGSTGAVDLPVALADLLEDAALEVLRAAYPDAPLPT